MSKINVDWSKFPDWVKAVAMDQDQEWFAFSCPPIKGITAWFLPDEAHQACAEVYDLTEQVHKAIHVDRSSEPLDWKDSLVLRPTEAHVPQKPKPVREPNIKVYPNRDAGMAIHYQGRRLEKDEFGDVNEETPEFKDEVDYYAVYVEGGSGYDLWLGDFETEQEACHFAQLAFNNLEPDTDYDPDAEDESSL